MGKTGVYKMKRSGIPGHPYGDSLSAGIAAAVVNTL